MYALLLLRGLIGTALANETNVHNIQWKAYKVANNKRYLSVAEDQYRKAIFLQNALKVAEHNALYEKGEVLFALELNKYADQTSQEFAGRHNGLKNVLSARPDLRPEGYRKPSRKLPKQWDWRDLGAVTRVKDQHSDQGTCAACWAFAATGALEGRYFLRTGELVAFSEQNLIDCVEKSHGCQGGLVPVSFKYVVKNGIARNVDYPYTGKKGQCQLKPAVNVTRIRGWAQVDNREKSLKEAVLARGPIAVGMDATLDSFQFYKSGIYLDSRCSSEKLSRHVLVVGYGSERGQDFWIVKNSFGPDWGEAGYMRLARNADNHCGIDTYAFSPTL